MTLRRDKPVIRPLPDPPPWHATVVKEVEPALGTGPEGLSGQEAARRLGVDGRNSIWTDQGSPRSRSGRARPENRHDPGSGTISPRDAREVPRAWHRLPVEEVGAVLDTGTAGLSEQEASRRLGHHGYNEVAATEETPWWRIVLHQFRDPLIYILLAAATVTIALGDYRDTGAILAVLLLNAVIGSIQELRARKAVRALESLSAPQAEVVRDGAPRKLPSRELALGDVVLLASGALVPADLRLTQVIGLEVDESALTGESVPVHKTADSIAGESLVPGDQANIAFSGTLVTRGRGRGVVVRTGSEAEIGRIATAIREVGHVATPLQEKLAQFGRRVGAAIIGMAGIVALVGLIRGAPPVDILMTAVAVAVGAIPEGLPVVLTVTLAIGVRRMARRHAIVRFLPAVETLGSTTVIGSDKTGTLTKNEMTVRVVWADGRRHEVTSPGDGSTASIEPKGRPIDLQSDPALFRTLLTGVLANEADGADAQASEQRRGDPTEIALLVAAVARGLSPKLTKHEYPELGLIPFESERQYMATLNGGPNDRAIYLKGAPEVVLQRCASRITIAGETPLDPDGVRAEARALAAEGLRVLGMAYRATDTLRLEESTLPTDFVFAGLVGMEDPVRPEAAEAVSAARSAGIRVLMLTGDHLETARAIGRRLGLGGGEGEVLDGQQIAALTDEELNHVVREVDIYARVAPEHKLRLVKILKAQGEIVAVTGDGVNDAPALRAAHIGIAMGRSGTDVARDAADMVLADDNFATITAAVEEGRVVFSNIRKVTFFLLSTGAGMILTILVAVLAEWPLPLLPTQILWINIVTGGVQTVALGMEPGERDLLRHRPRPADEGILSVRLLQRLGAVATVIAGGTLSMFWWTWHLTGSVVEARTVAMTQMVVFQFFHLINCRSLDKSIVRIPVMSNPFLYLSLAAATAAHLAALYIPALQTVFRTIPLTGDTWVLILMVGSAVILGAELDKWWNRRRGQGID